MKSFKELAIIRTVKESLLLVMKGFLYQAYFILGWLDFGKITFMHDVCNADDFCPIIRRSSQAVVDRRDRSCSSLMLLQVMLQPGARFRFTLVHMIQGYGSPSRARYSSYSRSSAL